MRRILESAGRAAALERVLGGTPIAPTRVRTRAAGSGYPAGSRSTGPNADEETSR